MDVVAVHVCLVHALCVCGMWILDGWYDFHVKLKCLKCVWLWGSQRRKKHNIFSVSSQICDGKKRDEYFRNKNNFLVFFFLLVVEWSRVPTYVVFLLFGQRDCVLNFAWPRSESVRHQKLFWLHFHCINAYVLMSPIQSLAAACHRSMPEREQDELCISREMAHKIKFKCRIRELCGKFKLNVKIKYENFAQNIRERRTKRMRMDVWRANTMFVGKHATRSLLFIIIIY